MLPILGPKKGIPPLAAARLQRWAILLSAYDIQFKSTDAHANADGLSRLPLSQTINEDQSEEVSLFNVTQMEWLPVTAVQTEKATKVNSIMSKVLKYVRHGWPSFVPEALKPFKV